MARLRSASANFKKHPIDLGHGLKLTFLSFNMSSTTGNFIVKAKTKYGPLSRSATVTISLGSIAHKLANLGAEIEKELSKVGNWF